MRPRFPVFAAAPGLAGVVLPGLLALVSGNAQRPRAFRVEQSGDEATIYVYDLIGGWFGGINAEAFAKELAAIKAGTIHLRINCPGGDVFDARAMITALRAHGATIVTHVDGLAASAASYLMLAGSRVEISQGAFVMVHNAWGMVMGNKQDMRDTADLLDKVDASIVAEYKTKSQAGKDWPALMAAETWFTADEALAAGLVDAVIEPAASAPPPAAAWNLAAFEHAPEALKNPPPPAAPEYPRAQVERRLRLLERSAA